MEKNGFWRSGNRLYVPDGSGGWNERIPAKDEENTSTVGMHYKVPVKMRTKGNIGNWKMTLETSVTIHHIFYEKRKYNDEAFNEMVAISVRAHEETHVVELWGALGRLEKQILREQNKRIPLRDISDEEVIADVGAIYALVKNGYSIDDIESFSKRFLMQDFKEALELYRDC